MGAGSLDAVAERWAEGSVATIALGGGTVAGVARAAPSMGDVVIALVTVAPPAAAGVRKRRTIPKVPMPRATMKAERATSRFRVVGLVCDRTMPASVVDPATSAGVDARCGAGPVFRRRSFERGTSPPSATASASAISFALAKRSVTGRAHAR